MKPININISSTPETSQNEAEKGSFARLVQGSQEVRSPIRNGQMIYDGIWDWWLVVGGCVGSAMVLVLVVALWMVMHARKKRRFAEEHGFAASGSKPFSASRRGSLSKMQSLGSYLSSGSDTSDIQMPPYRISTRPWRPPIITQSMSLDTVPNGSKTEVQAAALHRWNSITSTVYPTTVIGTVQPDLYRSSDEEDSSCSPPCSNGRLWFSLQYVPEEEQLSVHLIKAKYLPGRGLNSSPRDPFVRLLLLPDEENFLQSKVRKRTLAPKFNEIFSFKLEASDLPNRILRMSVYDIDKKKVRQCLGHVLIPLCRVDLFTNDVIWRDLENTWQVSTLGELEVCLSCNPLTNKIKVTVCKLKYVASSQPGARSSPADTGVFIKIQLLHGEKVMKTKYTHVRRSRSHEDDVPFEETYTFGVSGRYLDTCSIVLTACVVEGNKEQPYGRVVLGPFLYARGEQLAHWQEMMANPRHLVTKWHHLEAVNIPCG